jgi:hypothetical protein
MASTTREESMIEPSTIASGDSASTAIFCELEGALAFSQLDQLDRGAADVEADDAFGARE